MTEHFDLVVIGAGPAGEKGAAQAAYFGKRVCIIERAPRPGGAAANTGTIPSKSLRETALYFSGLRRRGVPGVNYHIRPNVAISDFMYRERTVVETEWARIDENLDQHGITIARGTATFRGAQAVEVTRYGEPTRTITGRVFLVATGSHPQPPDNMELDGSVVVDSSSVLTLERIPRNMVIIGGGAVGCEYASTFAALGSRVTLVNSRGRLLSQVDAEVSEALRRQMTSRLGVAVHVNTEVSSVTVVGDRAHVCLSDGMEIEADCVLHAAGRVGNSANIGLTELGVRTDHRDFIQVNEHFQTAVPSIYAAGDVIGYPALASASMEQARVAVCHAFDLRYKQQVAAIPYSVFTIPEIATVGASEEHLAAADVPFEVGRAFFRSNPRGQILGEVEGFVKLIFHPEDMRILGVSVVGEGASEVIHIGMTCMALGGTIDFFIQSVFSYPSLGESYKYAAYDGLQSLARRYARQSGLPSSNVPDSVPA